MAYIRDSKHRAKLKSAAMLLTPALQIGKNALTPEFIEAVSENIIKHELIKLSILNNCDDDPRTLAETIAERTRSEVVQIIGHRIVLYKPARDPKDRKYEP